MSRDVQLEITRVRQLELQDLVGPPKRLSGNATVFLFAGMLVVLATSSGLALTGRWAWQWAALANALALYWIYTVTHEAAHGLAARSRSWNLALGTAAAALEGMSFPLFRAVHLRHHRFTNHPTLDPDYIVGRRPRWLLPLWLLGRLGADYPYVIRHRLWRGERRRWVLHAAIVGTQVACILAAYRLGCLEALAKLWLLPALLAIVTVEVTVGLLVHHPHDSQEPLRDTRMYRPRWAGWLTLNQSLHLVHHLWVAIPWFRYRKALPQAERLLRRSEDPAGI